MDDLYRDYILEHYRNPRNKKPIENPDIVYEDSNPLCGDKLRFELKLSPDGQTVQDFGFTGRGCAISQASASMLSEEIIGKPVKELAQISRDDVLENLGIPLSAQRLKCAMLSLKVLRGSLVKKELAGKYDFDDDE